MKKLLFIFLTMFIFTNSINASEVQEIEYRYRFYKETIEGEYIKEGLVTDYQYEDVENISYGQYIDYANTCPGEDGYEEEYAIKYEYQKILPVQYIKISNLSEENMKISNIEIRDKDNLLNNQIQTNTSLTFDDKIITPGKSLVIKIESPVSVSNLNLKLEFLEPEKTLEYELVYSAKENYSAADLIAIVKGDTSMIDFGYDDIFFMYYNYTSTYIDYDIEIDDTTKIISQEEVCRAREIRTFRYNILKEYYDDNYYQDISELTNLTEEERQEYQKDLDDYIINYHNSTKSELMSNNLKLVNTGIEKQDVNYNYLIIYILSLILISLLILKHIKTMSNENDD